MINIAKKIVRAKYELNLEEVNKFVTGYIKEEKGKEPTAKQLQHIVQLISMGQFSLLYAAKEYLKKKNFQVYEVQDIQTKQVLRRDVYEIQTV